MAFVEVCAEEDRAAARALLDGQGDAWTEDVPQPWQNHWRSWPPSRVLEEAEAKLEVVAAIRERRDCGWDGRDESVLHAGVLRPLADIYRRHPGYRWGRR